MTPRIHFVTIVLDGQPFISHHYPIFRQLPMEWEWSVIEGTAAPVNCTNWVAPIEPRLSRDGTTEYLDSLAAFDKRVHLYRKPQWPGKRDMLNYALKDIRHPCLLWQVDSDEIWHPGAIMRLASLFADPENGVKNCADMVCRYFLGPDIVTTKLDTYGNNRSYEWRRVWRFKPGMYFKSHEPPVFTDHLAVPFTHDETMAHKIGFDHFAWSTEAQVTFKCEYYAGENNPVGNLYQNGIEGWRKLQSNTKWPVRVKDFLPWVDDKCEATRLRWCTSHNRQATHFDKRGERCCDPKLGGILLPCKVVV